MAVSKDELRNFINFADEMVKNGGAESIVDLASEWEAQRQETRSSGSNHAIQLDPETVRELAKAFPDVQDKESLERALARRGGVTTAEMLGKAMLAAARAGRL